MSEKDYVAEAAPPRYRVTFADGTAANGRTQDEIAGLINQKNHGVVANRQLVRTALRKSSAPWFLRNLAAVHVQGVMRL